MIIAPLMREVMTAFLTQTETSSLRHTHTHTRVLGNVRTHIKGDNGYSRAGGPIKQDGKEGNEGMQKRE